MGKTHTDYNTVDEKFELEDAKKIIHAVEKAFPKVRLSDKTNEVLKALISAEALHDQEHEFGLAYNEAVKTLNEKSEILEQISEVINRWDRLPSSDKQYIAWDLAHNSKVYSSTPMIKDSVGVDLDKVLSDTKNFLDGLHYAVGENITFVDHENKKSNAGKPSSRHGLFAFVKRLKEFWEEHVGDSFTANFDKGEPLSPAAFFVCEAAKRLNTDQEYSAGSCRNAMKVVNKPAGR